MSIKKRNIIEAKFQRDGKNLKQTSLVKEKALILDLLNSKNEKVDLLPEEDPIIFFESNLKSWYLITLQRLIVKPVGESIKYISYSNILQVSPLTNPNDFIRNKSMGLPILEVQLEDKKVVKIDMEVGSFSLVSSIIDYLRPVG